MKRIIILFFSLTTFAAAPDLTPQVEFFSEGAYWSGASIGSNTVFARAFAGVKPSLQPFLQMGSNQTFGEQGGDDIYFSPGIHWRFNLLKVYGEHRFHQKSSENSLTHEWRVLFVLGNTIDLPLKLQKPLVVFWEPYSELLLSSDQDNKVLFQGFSRLGLKYPFTNQTSTDVFLEPYLSFLQNSGGDTNDFQLRPSVRFKTCFDQICMSLSASRLFSTGSDLDPGFRFLAMLGGLI